ncbi:hypothetical protein MTO96_034740 [Rhipicephalus appendiculatus]
MAVLASTVRDMELYAKDFHDVEDEGRVACQNRLIGAVASNRNLTRLKLHIELLDATLPDYGGLLEVEMATLHDVTRRNSGLVELASRFVIRHHGDPYGERALKLVAEHPKLAETVSRETLVSGTVAKFMIEHALELVAPYEAV